ncbi:MAG TPA: arginase family protein [Symbiobacteriaceae bacterium]|nr:arginase family protein [Symbiobacteriaceae bacterium]
MNGEPVPAYVLGDFGSVTLLCDEGFTRAWKVNGDTYPPVRRPAGLEGIPLDVGPLPYFDYLARCDGDTDVALVGVPSKAGSLLPDSTVDGFPECLRSASIRYPVFARVDRPGSSGLYDLSEQRPLFPGLAFRDLGDLAQGAARDAKLRTDALRRLVAWSVGNRSRLFSIGGDHSITHTLVRSLAKETDRPVVLVMFDAHNDCGMNPFVDDQVDQSNFVRHLLTRQQVVSVIQVGVRGIRSLKQVHQHECLQTWPPHALPPGGLMSTISEEVKRFPEAIGYLSIDLDVLSPSEFPLVDFPVHGGMDTAQLISQLQEVFDSPLPIAGLDMVEGLPGGRIEQNHYDVPLRILAHCLDGINRQKAARRQTAPGLDANRESV